MANTLTGMLPTLYEARNRVSREMVGFIPAVNRNNTADRAALNDSVKIPIGVAGAAADITPGQQAPNTGDTTLGSVTITISKSRGVPIRWNGEERLSISNTGTYNAVLADQFEEAMRTLVNEIEVDLATEVKAGASRAFGTAGTTPFATADDLTQLANVKKILKDNGAPMGDLQCVASSAAWVNLQGKQSALFKVNEAGTDENLRNGMIQRLNGFAMRDSGGISTHTIGTGTGYLLNDASSAAGDTALVLDTGSGTILAGDVISFAADTANDYVVSIDGTTTLATINNPGLINSIADSNAMTIGAAYTPNSCFSKSAVLFASRAPALPEGGDRAEDRTTVVDPVSGIGFEVSVYREYRQVHFEVALAWGQKVIKPEHVATLVG